MNPPSIDDTYFCCKHSQSVDEQLFASVKPNRIWFLLEYPYSWGEKAFEESKLSAQVKDYFTLLLEKNAGSKLLLIKNQESLFSDKISLFVGLAGEIQPQLYKFQVDKYQDLLGIDVLAFLSSNRFPPESNYDNPIYLVCTNGKRDQCCAKYGLEVYNHLNAYNGESVWQTSHVGGHRFAANLLIFPHGIYYGRVTVNEAKTLMDSYRHGEILVNKYRGRACYEHVVQAAEYYLRNHTGDKHVNSYMHLNTQKLSPDRWQVQFAATKHGKEYQIDITSEPSDYGVFKSCVDENPVKVPQYKLMRIEVQ